MTEGDDLGLRVPCTRQLNSRCELRRTTATDDEHARPRCHRRGDVQPRGSAGGGRHQRFAFRHDAVVWDITFVTDGLILAGGTIPNGRPADVSELRRSRDGTPTAFLGHARRKYTENLGNAGARSLQTPGCPS